MSGASCQDPHSSSANKTPTRDWTSLLDIGGCTSPTVHGRSDDSAPVEMSRQNNTYATFANSKT